MIAVTADSVESIVRGSPYQAYVYAYPHKTAYRPLPAPRLLRDVWRNESRSQLSLYVHVPFCTMRCGFCNLFTTAQPNASIVTLYLDALEAQANVVRSELGDARFARLAIGGGTPTFLDARELQRLFTMCERFLGGPSSRIPVGIETSPDTITAEKIALLEAYSVHRISIGIQSFVEQETASCGRPQQSAAVNRALSLLFASKIPVRNLDLIYGLPNQTADSWQISLERALNYRPEELYLYPLYVRPLTGLGGSRKQWDDLRRQLYRKGRDFLLANGYEQVSMRMFRRADQPTETVPEYCCQDDGMVGLGCGARSYTRGLHYSLDYAVRPKGVREIIADYLTREAGDFAHAEYGFELDETEQRIRFLLQSILNVRGLSSVHYGERFGTKAIDDFPELLPFIESDLLQDREGIWSLTDEGLEWSDSIGPSFFSRRVRALMAEYEPR